MSKKPEKINEKIHCNQYLCINNTGMSCNGGGICKLENPDVNDYGNNVWGCGDERYRGDSKNK